jgi:hypothetical protein
MSTPRSTTLALLIITVGTLSVLTPIADVGVISVTTAQTSTPRKFSVTIKDGKSDTESIRVTQGEQVEITLASDQAAELHLHGYDLIAQLEPGVPATLSFVARIAGRFPVEAHRMGPSAKGRRRHPGALFYVEIYPP